jgi:dTDP-4-amino-4,6-dideoxygalactose transaminase
MSNRIPLVDLKKQYLKIREEINAAIMQVIDETAFIGDPGNRFVGQFESDFAAYIGTKHCIGCANGTDSIEILLRAHGIGPGDEVLVPAMTWISTASAVNAVGAKVVFVDIDPSYYTIDENLIEQHISPQTKAIIPVHFYGNMANMAAIMETAAKHKLVVIEDCAQAHGAEMNDKKAGTWGHSASFSFYPGKNLGAYGDAGGIVTNDDNIAAQCRMIANHGQAGKHNHQLIGRNSKLDGIQAAILSVKLKYLDQWTDARINNAATYDQYLNFTGLPAARPNSKHVFHLYVVQVPDRDKLLEELKANNIFAGIHYPVSLPFLPAYASWGHVASDFPVAHAFHSKIISLPMYAELTEEEIKQVAEVVNAVVNQEAASATNTRY